MATVDASSKENTGLVLSRFNSNEVSIAQGRKLLETRKTTQRELKVVAGNQDQIVEEEFRGYCSSSEDQETKNMQRRQMKFGQNTQDLSQTNGVRG
jgi:hypothetical protein